MSRPPSDTIARRWLPCQNWLSCQSLVVGSFFAVFFVIGLFVSRDYGISWDEQLRRDYGRTVYEYVFEGNGALLQSRSRYYGSGVELPLYAAERMLGLEDGREIYLFRHACTFLIFFGGVFFFFLLCKLHFQDWRIGLFGATLLILSPRIFADGFFNTKDIPFLVFFIVSAYTLLRYLERRSIFWATTHALACSLLIDIRIPGVIMVFITLLFAGMDLRKTDLRRETIISIAWYLLILTGCTVFFWPTLWHAPLAAFVESFQVMKQYPWGGNVFYFGQYISANHLPWHYLFVWIAITTPLSYTVLSILGMTAALPSLLKKNEAISPAVSRNRCFFFLWFWLPLAAILLLHSTLYGAWRHVFFVYPALILFTLEGCMFLLRQTANSLPLRNLFLVPLGTSLCFTLAFMLRNHPFEQVYFQPLARSIAGGFDRDYWGTSYRQGFEYILAHDASDVIPIAVANLPGELNIQILPPSERRRVRIVQQTEEARYFLTNYHHKYTEVLPYRELKALSVSGLKIMGIYFVDCDHPFSLTFWTSCASYLKGPRNGATPEQLADFKAKMDEISRAAARCGYSGFGFDRCQKQPRVNTLRN